MHAFPPTMNQGEGVHEAPDCVERELGGNRPANYATLSQGVMLISLLIADLREGLLMADCS
jgi:hypothetical protein